MFQWADNESQEFVEAEGGDEAHLQALIDFATSSEKVVAIGECGLGSERDSTTARQQWCGDAK